MKILYFHQHFSTPQGSSGTRSYEFARALVARGYSVTMVCGASAFGGVTLPRDSRRDWSRGMVDGIDVIALPLPYSNHDRLGRRALVFLRFAWRSVLLALREKYDVLFATSTPLTAAIPGLAARWLRHKPFIFEVRDLWPELPRALGLKNPLILGSLSLLEWAAYHSCTAAVGLSPGIVEGIKRRAPRSLPVAMIPNGSDLDLFHPRLRKPLVMQGIETGDFVAGFAGAHGIANGLDAVLDAAAVLQQRGVRRIKFVFIGDGREKERLIERARSERLENCLFFPPVPKTELAAMTASLGCGLMILKNVKAFYYGTSPNKFFDYLAAGVPILINYPGWLADMVEAERCGVVVPPDEPNAFADAVRRLADDPEMCRRMGAAGRKLAEREFARELLAERFVKWVEGFSGGSDGTQCRAKQNQEKDSIRTMKFYRNIGKRLLDFTASALGLLALAPLLALLALLVRFKLGRPVLFRQTRPGLYGRPFELMKFRTMADSRDGGGQLLPDSERLTPFGRFLRDCSLDELPELINVLKGDMSLVGPRPLLMDYLRLYSPEQARRHEVRPGITGWAQIHGRNAQSWAERFKLDVWYVDHHSIWGDIQILAMTVLRVFRREGISAEGHATMPRFRG